MPAYVTLRHKRKILIFGNIYLDFPASSIEKTKEEGGARTLVFILVYKAGGGGSQTQTKSLLRGYYGMCVVLKFSTEALKKTVII
jgi:hypothetical protein